MRVPVMNQLDDDELITEDWLRVSGFKPVESDLGPTYSDHWERDGINIWEFNGTGNWLWSGYDSVEMRTRGKLRQLLEWLEETK